MLLAASAAAERFFSFKQVDGMGQALAVLAPGLIGYALIYQVTRVLFAADHSRPAAHATAAGWLTVAVACAACVRLMAPAGGDGRATLVALGVGTTIGMTVAGASLLIVLARVMGGRVLRATLTALVAGLPVALVLGLAVRGATTRVTSLPLAVITAVIGAAAAAALVLRALPRTARQVTDDGDHDREYAHEDEAAREAVVHDVGGQGLTQVGVGLEPIDRGPQDRLGDPRHEDEGQADDRAEGADDEGPQ